MCLYVFKCCLVYYLFPVFMHEAFLRVKQYWLCGDICEDAYCILWYTYTYTLSAGRGVLALAVLVSLVNSLCTGFPTRCGYETSSRLLRLSLLPSPFASSSPLCLLGKRDRHRQRERKRQKSASNLKRSLAVLCWVLTPLCVKACCQVPLKEKHKLNS